MVGLVEEKITQEDLYYFWCLFLRENFHVKLLLHGYDWGTEN